MRRMVLAAALISAQSQVTCAGEPAARPSYRCTVTDFVEVSEKQDIDFAAMNRKRTFTIVDGGTELTLNFTGIDGTEKSSSYKVYRRGALGTMAISPPLVSIDALVLDNPDVARMLGRPVTATMTVQLASAVNVWRMTCDPADN